MKHKNYCRIIKSNNFGAIKEIAKIMSSQLSYKIVFLQLQFIDLSWAKALWVNLQLRRIFWQRIKSHFVTLFRTEYWQRLIKSDFWYEATFRFERKKMLTNPIFQISLSIRKLQKNKSMDFHFNEGKANIYKQETKVKFAKIFERSERF